ncbi:MAG: ABC transporter permease [Acidimicrobiales bacterium]|jgi:ABC-2 type transport system permease protein
MTTLIYAVRDSTTMLRRDIRHAVRYPMVSLSGVMVPVLFLLLFAGVFGHTLRAGLGAVVPSGGGYIDYLTPGILLMTACSTAEITALNVSTDMTEGIIARFRAMAITRTSVLTGQVLGGLIRAMISAILVVAVALALGFHPTATAVEWIEATAVFALLAVAVTWLTVSFGLVAKTPAGANSLSLLVVVLPFISSAFVPTATMPAGVAWFARNQPFTPIIQTLRGLFTGTPIGNDAILAVAWCVAISVLGYLWARSLYNRNRAA